MSTVKFLRSGDRLALAMILATLAVIGVVIAMLYSYQSRSLEQRVRADTISLTRVLARLPHSELVAKGGLLEAVRQSWQDRHFAYALIVGADGTIVSEVAAPGIIAPPVAFPKRPDVWISEREITLPSGMTVIDIQAPLLERGDVVSYLRLGFAKPTFAFGMAHLPFVATLAFAVFLLAPIFWWLLRREVRPLRHANGELNEMLREQRLAELKLSAHGELGEFMGNINAFIKMANGRLQALQSEQTNLKTRAQLLSYRKSRAETVLDSIPEAIIIIDQTGTISFANQRVETLLDTTRQQVMKQNPNEWCRDESLLNVLDRYTSRHASRKYMAQTVVIQARKSSPRNLSVKAYPIFAENESHDALGTLIVIRDVSKEVQSQRTQSEFVTHVAHELKTPLHTVNLACERLLYETLSENERIESTNIVQDETDRMASLINDLLSITKIEMGQLPVERSHLKLREFLQDVFDTVTRSGANKQLNFELHLPNDFEPVFLDKDLMRIALNNLLTNAIKYSDPGGTVSLRAAETEDKVNIAVSDTGIGISDVDQERIFSKFFRADDESVRERSGHGLGLSLCHEIVQMHGGTLTVDSAPGRGSVFTIELRKETNLLQRVV